MVYYNRQLTDRVQQVLKSGKSLLLLGPRQTGKTTLIEHECSPDWSLSFLQPRTRLRYEQDPQRLADEITKQAQLLNKKPLIFIDEIQKVPGVMDIIQWLIDHQIAQFILSGSSARKLKQGHDINLLPGRVIALRLDPLQLSEMSLENISLEDLLIDGSLPEIIATASTDNREALLQSYVSTYLEDEIRSEAVVRNIGHFSRFLELAAGESGNILNSTKLSQDIGVADTTIVSYFQILLDCLISFRIDPLTESNTKRRLIKSPKILFFDLGVRRVCANEGRQLSEKTLAHLFEQFIGLELIRIMHCLLPNAKLRYWRDAQQVEVDYVLDKAGKLTPIEVKWSKSPTLSDARHLMKFLEEYENTDRGYIVCRTPMPYDLNKKVSVIPWQFLSTCCE